MILRRRTLKAITWALILSFGVSLSPAQAELAESKRVEIIQATKKINEVVVESALPWSEGGLEGARAIIESQKSTLEAAMKRLRKLGATKMEVVNLREKFTEPRWINKSKYGDNFSTWRMLGMTSLGKESGKSVVFPRDQTILANYLTRIEPGTCSLVEFSFFQPQTWFLPKKCRVSVPEPEQFLRAALATNLQKITWDVGYWEISALEFALTERTHLWVKDGYLYCPELSRLSTGQNRILLDLVDPLGGYSISVNLKNRTAVFTFKNLDQRALAKDAYKLEGQDFIGFFVAH
jgi:hypothetical protein